MELKILDHGYVRYVESWGSDERIIESARMSTSGDFKGWDGTCKECDGLGVEPYSRIDPPPELLVCLACGGKGTTPGDEKLLRYLWEHKHATPFEMAGLTIEVQAPIFVFREWHRHRTQSYNELSARYSEMPNLFYVPSEERLMNGRQSSKSKQGSEAGFTSFEARYAQGQIELMSKHARGVYEDLLKMGLSRELARLVLPVNQYSRMRASANLRNWLAFLSLRLDSSAQHEIRLYAEAVATIVGEKLPRTFELFKESL